MAFISAQAARPSILYLCVTVHDNDSNNDQDDKDGRDKGRMTQKGCFAIRRAA